MCGICGIFNTALEPLSHAERIGRMSARLVHRGPDSHGKFELPYLALAIRRLSIIDLKTGDQPLSNEADDVSLVFNGEIYNFRELRRRLEEHGHRFRTGSDGEVIVHLYEESGPEFTSELNGMFAVALWDSKQKRLVLARDRAGEKPLYYWLHDHSLIFASEIKAILEYPEVSRKLDLEAVRQYLFYGYVPSPRTIFKGIKKLPAGHRMVVEGGKVHIESYWRLRDHLRPPDGSPVLRSEQEITQDLRSRLREAAISRLVSDVPLGVFLSGGVDSSTLVALMSDLAPGQVNTFSVGFPEKSFNEEPYAAMVARHFRTRHHVLTTDEAALRRGLEAMAAHLDEPLADPAVIPTFLLSQFARNEIKVALSGEGSDEMFGGYPTYFGAKLARCYLRLPQAIRRKIFERLAAVLPASPGAVPVGMFLRRFILYAERNAAERHQIWFGMLSPQEVNDVCVPDLSSGTSKSPLRAEALFRPLYDVTACARFENEIAEALYVDFCLYLADDLLVKLDRASMACSLELRTPFLDHRLVEFAAGLPSAFKVRGFRLKYLLKKAVEPWIPRLIVRRQKRGFSVPIAGWLRKELRPLLREMLSEPRLNMQGLFQAGSVRRAIDEHCESRADHRKLLWTLLMFQLWYEHWA